jgi:hypothetical protein
MIRPLTHRDGIKKPKARMLPAIWRPDRAMGTRVPGVWDESISAGTRSAIDVRLFRFCAAWIIIRFLSCSPVTSTPPPRNFATFFERAFVDLTRTFGRSSMRFRVASKK